MHPNQVYPFYLQERIERDEDKTIDLNNVKKAIILHTQISYDINYDVMWDKTLRLLSIEINLNWRKEGQPPKFRKLVDADTLHSAYKSFLEFEEKEKEAVVSVFKNYITESHKNEDLKRKKYAADLYEADKKKVKDHYVKAGDSLMNFTTKSCHIVQKVESQSGCISYILADKDKPVYQYEVFKEKVNGKGAQRKVGYLYLGNIVPGDKKGK